MPSSQWHFPGRPAITIAVLTLPQMTWLRANRPELKEYCDFWLLHIPDEQIGMTS